jgi:hypothetical protein
MFSRYYPTTLALSLAMCLNSSLALAAESNFYTMEERWQKQQLVSHTDKGAAIDSGFSSALLKSRAQDPTTGVSVAPTLRRTFQDVVASESIIELEPEQTLLIENIQGLLKYVSTDAGVVTLETLNPDILKMTATGLGSTFVHVWTQTGRSTFSVRVIGPKFSPGLYQIRQTEALEKSRPFHLLYDNGRSASYNGEKYRVMTRSSSDFTQNFGLKGDTPYGEIDSHMQLQKTQDKTLLSGANITLKDGKIGNLKNFNAIAGDSQVKPDLMALPVARIRGGQVEHWADDKRVQWNSFYGRENQAIFGALTPGATSKRTLNSYLTGSTVDFKVNEDAKLKAGYYQATGQSRPDNLNRRGMAAQSEIKLGEFSVFNTETSFDNEHTAQRHSITSNIGKVKVRNEFRDISKKFFTLVGNPYRQGEVGNLTDFTFQPNQSWSYTGSFDIFRDRLIPNPEDPDRYNTHSDFMVNWIACDDVSVAFTFQDMDDTGRVGPSRQRTIGLQYSEGFDLWGRRATLFSRYQHRVSHQLTNSLSDYRNNQTTVGVYTPLFWGINFSVQKEWNALEEVEISRYTHPNAVTYSWDTSRQIGNTPFYFDARLRIRDEEQTESTNSFMQGEDSTEVSGGLYYREYENMELFLTGSFTQFVAESQNVLEPRVQAEFFTGMRYDMDTGFRWQPVGSFDGYVFKDQNGDGVRQPYEPGIPNLKITADGKEDVSDEKGYFEIKGVAGKKAVLLLDTSHLPTGFVPTSSADQATEIIPGKTKRIDFGLTPRSEISGLIFNDLNGDGLYSSNEFGIGQVKVSLEDDQIAKSNEKGVYSFSKAVAGEHTASLQVATLPEGYLPVNVPKKSFTLYEGIRYELNFPLMAKRTISGRVYYDQNANKIMDRDEAGLSGVRVRLDDQTVSSDEAGWYLFDSLKSGAYQVSVDAASLPAGFQMPSAINIELPKGPLTRSDVNIPLGKTPERPTPQGEGREYGL